MEVERSMASSSFIFLMRCWSSAIVDADTETVVGTFGNAKNTVSASMMPARIRSMSLFFVFELFFVIKFFLYVFLRPCHVVKRIERLAVFAYAEVAVVAAGIACITAESDHMSLLYDISDLDKQLGVVGIKG